MTSLYTINVFVLPVLIALYCLCMVMQLLHILSALHRESDKLKPIDFTVEIGMLVHLFTNTAISFSIFQNPSHAAIWFMSFHIHLDLMIWLNCAVAFLALVALCMTKSPIRLSDFIAVAWFVPPLTFAVGDWGGVFFIANAAYFVFREATLLQADRDHQKTMLMKFSPAMSTNSLSEGLLYFDSFGRTVFMNTSMRETLNKLNIGGDLSDMREVWTLLLAQDVNRTKPRQDYVLVKISDDEIRQFTIDKIKLRNRSCTRIVSIDVTQETKINLQINEVNKELEHQQAQIQKSTETLHEIVENDAILLMRSRVHDVIGQRLSILHRYLEDGIDTPESHKRIKELLGTIMDDLSSKDYPTYEEALQMIVEAFSIAGIKLSIHGDLPQNERICDAFANIIRESATNATIHAQAMHVDVTITSSSSEHILTVTNDGFSPPKELREGTGIPGMRRAAGEIGGIFSYDAGPPFVIRVIVPNEGESQ